MSQATLQAREATLQAREATLQAREATPACDVTIVCSDALADAGGMEQLQATLARHSDIVRAVAMPDLHGGPGVPIGVCFQAPTLYPRLVGGDIGCGMTLFRVHGKAQRWKPDKLAQRLERLVLDPLPNAGDLLRANGLPTTPFDDDLGTLGGGNHFAELLAIEHVYDAASLPCDPQALLLLVHSGSRRLGQHVLKCFNDPSSACSEVAAARLVSREQQRAYLRAHDEAVAWALANRMLVAHRVADALGMEAAKVLNIVHNYLELNALEPNALEPNSDSSDTAAPELCFLHRKGVGRVPPGHVTIIPGSRGNPSYLVRMTDDAALAQRHLCSVAHGAGRKWTRSKAEAMSRQTPQQLRRTALGSRVVCDDAALLRQEAPEAYKDIDGVIQDLTAAGLVTRVARLMPLCTYKQ